MHFEDPNGLATLESMSQAVWYNRWTFKNFSQFVTGDIFEVGCGIGNFTSILTEYGRVWACDIKPSYVKRTKQRVEKRGVIGLGNIETGKLFFGSKQFNTIVCLNVLEHIRDDQVAIKHMYQLLKPGGHLIVLVPIYSYLYGSVDMAIGHFRRYVPSDLMQVVQKAGFHIVHKRILNFIGAFAWFVTGSILKRKTLSRKQLALFDRFAPFILPLEDIVRPPIGTSILLILQK